MRQTGRTTSFDKSVSFFVNHINNRVMFFRMTIGTYKYILIGHCKSLRSHGSTYRLFCTLCIQECSCISQSGNNISSVLFFFFSALKGKVFNSSCCDSICICPRNEYTAASWLVTGYFAGGSVLPLYTKAYPQKASPSASTATRIFTASLRISFFVCLFMSYPSMMSSYFQLISMGFIAHTAPL